MKIQQKSLQFTCSKNIAEHQTLLVKSQMCVLVAYLQANSKKKNILRLCKIYSTYLLYAIFFKFSERCFKLISLEEEKYMHSFAYKTIQLKIKLCWCY